MLAAKPLTVLMNAPAEAFDQTVLYVIICSGGAVFIVAYNVISGIFRGIGNSKLPLLFVGIACITNILGDLLLVGVFNLDAVGAAIATIFAQAASVVFAILFIRKKGLPFEFSKNTIGFHRVQIRRILKLGSPIALQDALTNVSFLIITAIINSLGLIASVIINPGFKRIF